MNTPQAHDRVYLWIDRVGSKRYRRQSITDALNVAINWFIKDRYDNIKKETGYSFELVERIRQELYTLIVETNIVPTGVRILTPANFVYELVTFLTLNEERVLSQSRTYNENDLQGNSFMVPNLEYPLHRRSSLGYEYDFSGNGTFTNVQLFYLRRQVDMVFGNTKITAGAGTLIIGQNYYVEDAAIVSNGITYQPEDSFVATSTAFTGAGNVTRFVNCDLPETAHEEICGYAAAFLSGQHENFNKAMWTEKRLEQQ